MINSVLAQGIQGVQRGMSGMDQAARRIATAMDPQAASSPSVLNRQVPGGNGLDDLTTGLVELRLYRVQVEASTKVVRTADEALGTLLDVKA